MKQLIINRLALHNFKGIRSAEATFSRTGATITGHNAVGKSTMADAFCFLLRGEDAAGHTPAKFSLKTVDASGDFIPDLEHSAEGSFSVIDTETGEMTDISLRRSYVEEWKTEAGETERKLDGHHVDYFVNDIPVKKSEYEKRLAEIMPDNLLKIMTIPGAFFRQSTDTMRGELIAMAGDVDPQEVAAARKDFADLISKLNGESLENYRTMIGAQRKRVIDRLDKIPTEIDATRAATPDPLDFEDLERQKKELDKKIDELTAAANNVADRRRLQYEEAAKIQDEIGRKEQQRRQELNRAQMKLDQETSEKNRSRRDAQQKIFELKDDISRAEAQSSRPGKLAQANDRRQEIKRLEKEQEDRRAQFDRVAEQTYNPASLICPRFGHECQDPHACSQGEAAFNSSKAETLNRYLDEGHKCNDRIEELTRQAETLEAEHAKEQEANKARLAELRQKLAETDALLATLPETPRRTLTLADLPGAEDYEKELADLRQKADQATSADTGSTPQAPTHPDAKRHAQMERDEILRKLGLRDVIAKNDATIEKLRQETTKLAQEKANLELLLKTADEFSQALTDAVERKINALFDGVQFRMFKPLINGKREPDCVALVNGVRYPDVNTAGKIQAGLQVIKAISRHYHMAAPVFIDNCESIATMPEPAEGQQVIRLKLVEGEPLTVTPD